MKIKNLILVNFDSTTKHNLKQMVSLAAKPIDLT